MMDEKCRSKGHPGHHYKLYEVLAIILDDDNKKVNVEE